MTIMAGYGTDHGMTMAHVQDLAIDINKERNHNTFLFAKQCVIVVNITRKSHFSLTYVLDGTMKCAFLTFPWTKGHQMAEVFPFR